MPITAPRSARVLARVAVLGFALLAPAARGELSLADPDTISALPVETAQIGTAIAQLPAIVARALADSGIPGLAVAVVHEDALVFAAGYGVRDARLPARVDADTAFQLASVSKAIGATVVASEVGRGTLGWDTPVAAWLPAFRLRDARVVTIGDLYAHRSGLPDHAGDELEILGHDPATILGRLAHLPLGAHRLDYAYTNFGLTFAAQAVATAAGLDWASLCERNVYAPLGMHATSSRHADFLARANRARLHARVDGRWQPLHEYDPDGQSPAGGVSSSARDLAAWMRLVLARGRYDGRELIDVNALAAALAPQSVSTRAADPAHRSGFYGYGFNIGTSPSGRQTLSHSGAFTAGAATAFLLLPSLDLGIVVLTNAMPIGVAERVLGEFSDLIQFGAPQTDWSALLANAFAGATAPIGDLADAAPPSRPAPARAPAAYAGRYRSAYFGDAEVIADGATLRLALGRLRQPLAHWDGDHFALDLPGTFAPQGSRSSLTFAGGADGGIEAFTIAFLDEHGLATFSRRGVRPAPSPDPCPAAKRPARRVCAPP